MCVYIYLLFQGFSSKRIATPNACKPGGTYTITELTVDVRLCLHWCDVRFVITRRNGEFGAGWAWWRWHSPSLRGQSRWSLFLPWCRACCVGSLLEQADCRGAGIMVADSWVLRTQRSRYLCLEQWYLACFPLPRFSDMCWLDSHLLMPVLSVTSAMRLPPWVSVKRMNFVACCRKPAVINRRFHISPRYCLLISHELIIDWWTKTERCQNVILALFGFLFACPSPSPCLGWLDFNGRILVLSLFKEIHVFWFCFSNSLFDNSCKAMCLWRSPTYEAFALWYKWSAPILLDVV